MSHKITSIGKVTITVAAAMVLIVLLIILFGAAAEDAEVFVTSWQYPVQP